VNSVERDQIRNRILTRRKDSKKIKAKLSAKFGFENYVSFADFIDARLTFMDLGLSDQAIAKLEEGNIKRSLGLLNKLNDESGDASTTSGRHIEIKSSISYESQCRFLLKRLRDFHSLTDYLLHFFDLVTLSPYWFFVPAQALYELGHQYNLFKSSTTGTPKTNKENKNVEKQMVLPTRNIIWDELQQYRYFDFETLRNKVHSEIDANECHRPFVSPQLKLSFMEYDELDQAARHS